jgi:hypothetical protein
MVLLISWVMQGMGVRVRYNTHVSFYKHEQFSQILKINCRGKGLFKFNDDKIISDWEA